MKTPTRYIISVFLSILIFVGCTAEDEAEDHAKSIENFVTGFMRGDSLLKLTVESGINYLYHPGDTTVKVKPGDTLVFDYSGYTLKDTANVFVTNMPDDASKAKIDTVGMNFDPRKTVAGDGRLLPGLDKGLMMAHKGDSSIRIIFPPEFGFGNKSNGIVPPNSALVFCIYNLTIK